MLAFLLGAVLAAAFEYETEAKENPIRRIVNLLQKMQTEIEAEAKKDEDLNDNFACYCKTNDGALSESTAGLRAKIPEIESDIKEAESLKAQLDQELKDHKADRVAAKEAIDSATKQRQKEAEEFAASSSELNGNINSCKSAVTALTKGLQGSFLQTPAANTLRNLVVQDTSLDRYGRETMTEFLSVSAGVHYTPVSNEVIGILKTMQEGMEKDLADITKVENDAITTFEGLVSAKEKEIAAATEAIEVKTQRAGETAVQIVSSKNELEDTKDSLGADERFLMELKKNCASGAGEYEARKQARSEELVAITETIKVLNDDDALDLFKKTLASPSLLQMQRQAKDIKTQAMKALKKARGVDVNFILLALKGKKQGFDKVIKMIDGLVGKLGEEQKDDDAQRDWCQKEFDSAEDESKALKRRIGGLETKIAENEEAITKLVEEVEALNAGIKALDKAVEEASDQRRDEHKAFTQTMAENNAALQLLEIAKNRLNKFYNPAVYKAPEQRELTEDEQIYVNSGGTDPRIAENAAPAGGIAGTGVESPLSFVQFRDADTTDDTDAPPPPPETMDAYTKKDAGGPVALIDRLKRDLERDTQECEHDEKEAQKDYEQMMSDSVAKRTADSKSVTEKEAQKAELEADLMGAKDLKKSKTAEFMATQEYITQLHGSCDFLLQNYDLRKEARANEVEALKNAKAVLSGADFSFAQASTKHFLVRRSN
jgi:hypothetical protein